MIAKEEHYTNIKHKGVGGSVYLKQNKIGSEHMRFFERDSQDDKNLISH